MASRLTLSIIFLFFMMTISPMSKNFDNELEDEPLILASSESGFEWEWADSISSDNYDDIYAMTVDEEGNTYVGGAYRGQTVNVQANSSQNPNAPSGDPLFAKFDVDGNVVWLKSFGVTNSSLAIYGLSMSLSGNVIACGGFSQNFTIDGFSVESLISGGGVGNSWLAEFDEDGSLQWIKSMQNAAICVGQGGNSAISVSEVDGSIYTYGFSAVFHNAGPQNISIYSGVEVNNSNDFNNYNHYVSTLSYLIKFDSNGNYQWRQHMFCGTYYCSSDLDLGISEGEEIIYVTGHVYAHLSFNNSATELWTTSTDSFLHTEFYVAAFDSQFGNLKWANNASASASFPSNGNGAGVGLSPEEPSISVDGLGNAIIGGNFYSNMTFQTQPPTQLNVSWDVTGCFSKHDAFVAKIDAFGEWKWARDVGSNSSCVEIINDLETNYEGSILLTGGFMGRSGQNILEIGNHSFTTAMSGSYDYDIFIAGMDPSGNWSMAEVTEGSSNNYALNVGFLNNTHGYIGAEIYDSITYGQTTLSEPSTNANNWIFVGQFSFENMSVDEDLDGVMNDDDECPETPLNTLVDYDGCAADFELVYVEEDLWGTGGSIAIDSNDEVYISAPYYSGKLNLFQLNTSTNAISWDKHVVIDGLDRDYGHDTSLYFDSNDIPHIAFHMLDNRSMEYTVLNETVWEFSVIDEIASNGIANVGQQHDIVVDSENNPHIIYNDGIYGNSGYVYSTLVDGVWVSNYTFQSMSGFGKNSMAIDSNDNLHVIYTSNDGSIIYATNEDGYWDLNHTLGIQGDLSNSYDFDDSEAAISIGADGDVHMSYCLMQNGGATWDVGNGSLMYSKKENGQWMTETIETGIDCSFHNGERGHSILVDGYGFAHILYYVNQEGTGAPDKLVYSTNTKSSWDTYNLLEKLDSIHEQTSMAVDSHNNIHLIFEHRPTSPNGYVTTSYMQINRDWTEYDDDLDGVPDGDDQCPNTPEGVSVNQDGCSVAQLDEDGDGVGDYIDQCPNTPAGEIVDFFGCSQSQLDDDGDGVMNDVDQCPNTPSGETVDAIGCSQSQLDDDGDGIMNDVDQCPNTPPGEPVDDVGCASSQLDDDGDGVMNDVDQCPNTPSGETVDAIGCSQSQLDDDGDGIMNDVDQCPNTPSGETVDAIGCSQSQLDDDGDGIMNDVDQCPNTPSGETVDAIGCSQSQLDDDGDGIMNDVDQCPNTAYGINVGLDGCNHPPVCTFSYEDNSATQTVFAQDLPLGTGSQVAVLTLSPGNYNFNVECNDPEFDLIQMTIVFDNGNGHMFTDSPLISGPLPVTLSDGLSLSKTITYDWIDGANSGTYQVDISIVGDDDANSSGSSWLPGFGIELLLCALFIAFILVNRRE